MLNKSYKTIYDFVLAHTKPTKGKIKVVEDGKEMFLEGDELKTFCDGLKERLDKKEAKVFVEKTRVVVMKRG